MQKKYIVRLTGEERWELQEVIRKLKGTSQKVRRAQLLLKADAEGPAWSDSRIAEAFACRRQTGERLRQRFVESGFQETLGGKTRAQPPTAKGYANWTLRLLARKVGELALVDSVSYETVRRTLKKTG